MTEALEWIEEFTSNSTVSLLQPTDESFRQTLRWMREFHLGANAFWTPTLPPCFHTSGVRRLLTPTPQTLKCLGVLETVTP